MFQAADLLGDIHPLHDLPGKGHQKLQIGIGKALPALTAIQIDRAQNPPAGKQGHAQGGLNPQIDDAVRLKQGQIGIFLGQVNGLAAGKRFLYHGHAHLAGRFILFGVHIAGKGMGNITVRIGEHDKAGIRLQLLDHCGNGFFHQRPHLTDAGKYNSRNIKSFQAPFFFLKIGLLLFRLFQSRQHLFYFRRDALIKRHPFLKQLGYGLLRPGRSLLLL